MAQHSTVRHCLLQGALEQVLSIVRPAQFQCVAHRVVHGGSEYSGATELSLATLQQVGTTAYHAS